jgi:NADPH-dependent 2,4-dienoyl-CoA reductase/sulfur reductase-like enzyme
VAHARIVVVGAALAGLRVAEALRARGFAGHLTLVGAEMHPPYDRPPLSKQLLAGSIEPAECTLPQDPGLDATWMLGRRASGLDMCERRVELDDGARLPYDGLVIATGSRARRWPSAQGVHVLRSVDDALALRTAARRARRIAVVGSGFIGCEVAATLRAGGRDVTLVGRALAPLTLLGPVASEACARMHAAHGVRLRMGALVTGFERDGTAVYLEDGDRIEADVVLLALGAAPNVEWLQGSGLTLTDGVVTDTHCFADAERRVVAVGDVAAFPHPLAGGEHVSIRHWSNAVEQASVAATNLLAEGAEGFVRYEPVPSFWSDQHEVRIQGIGFPHLADRAEEVEGAVEANRFVTVATRGGRIVGAVAFGRPGRIAAYRVALAEAAATPLDAT